MSAAQPKAQRRADQIRVKIIGAWTASPNRLLRDRRLSRDARLLGALMFMHAGNSGVAFPSQEALADELSHTVEVVERDEAGRKRVVLVERQISVRSVQRWLSELKRAGWLSWRQTMRCNEYTLLDPSESDEPPGDDGTPPRNGSGGPPPAHENGAAQIEAPPGNRTETRATAVSPTTIPVSPSNTTQGSPSNTTQGSPTTTPVSCPSIMEDSWDSDSSSSEAPADDDDESVVALLRSRGVVAAEEFRPLDLAAVRGRIALLERDPKLLPGGIVKSLRSDPPRATKARASPRRTSYAEAERRARAIAPGDVTEDEIALLAAELEDGARDDQALDLLASRRWRAASLPPPRLQ